MQNIIGVMGVSVSKTSSYNKVMGSSEHAGSCPQCHCTDAFHVYPDMNNVPGIGPIGYFLCMDTSHGGRNGCGWHGDSISFTEEKYGLSFEDACVELGIDPLELINYRREHRGQEPATSIHKRNQRTKALAETSMTWRTTALAFAKKASANLAGEPLDYLLSRGFPGSTIKSNLLGFYPEYRFVKAALWGCEPEKKMLLLPKGIVIPWFNAKNEVICLRIRRLPSDESEEAKKYYGVDKKTGEINRYKAIYGSASAFLYHAEFVAPGCNVAMFEGELDALAAGLQAGLDIVCVATGSTGWGRSEETKRLLSQAEQVLICFDNDANLAGDRASEYWLGEMSHARRWRPMWHDANDMLRDGVDLAEWLSVGFLLPITATPEPEEVVGEPTDEELLRELLAAALPPLCCQCLNENVETVAIGETEEGAYCNVHRPGQDEAQPVGGAININNTIVPAPSADPETRAHADPVTQLVTQLFQVKEIVFSEKPEMDQQPGQTQEAENIPRGAIMPISLAQQKKLGSRFNREVNAPPDPARFAHLAGGYEAYKARYKPEHQ